MAHQLIVLPNDTADAIVAPIDGARHSINIRTFLFTDPRLLDAVIAAHRRGVTVRVMLNRARRDGTVENEGTREVLRRAGVQVRDGNPDFALTHQKSMVIDGRVGFIESLNWDSQDFTETRDYAVRTTDLDDVSEMTRCFDADWNGQTFVPKAGSRLIWCPDNGRQKIADFIDAAKHSLWLQNERYQDMVIIERLVRAAHRGVRLRVMSQSIHKLKPKKLFEGVSGLRIIHDVGAKVRTLRHLRLHGKIMLADGRRAIVGSINLSPGSFDERRELAIETSSEDVIRRLTRTVAHDWRHGHRLDLSDQAVLAGLTNHGLTNIGSLALHNPGESGLTSARAKRRAGVMDVPAHEGNDPRGPK